MDWFLLCVLYTHSTIFLISSRQEGHADEFELGLLLLIICHIGRIDNQNMVGGLVGVSRDILAIDGLSVLPWLDTEREGLEVLEEPGLDAAHEGLEALGGGLGAVVEDALFQGEGGADADPFEGSGVVPPPRDEGLVVAGDGQDVALEPALLQGGRGGVGADPVPVADAR